MARVSTVRAYLLALVIVFSLTSSIILVFFLAPYLIERYYPAAAPIAAAIVWLRDAIDHGLATMTFLLIPVLLGALAYDAHIWLTRRRTARRATPGTVALEGGTATPMLTSSHAAQQPTGTVASKLLSLLSFTYFLMWHLFRTGIVSLERPFLENLGSALMYLLSGMPVVITVFWICVFVDLLHKRRSAATAAQANTLPAGPLVEVLFDDAASNGDSEEKAQVL
ncbi:hypothetical protein B0H12DRAFT_1239654 [Mycena haematopus]|nr:hypothetical protein B0H12DRAFT_1239654 [Mycena haematopus]